MRFKAKRKIVKIKEFIFDLLKIIIGTAIIAIGIEQFLLPNQLSIGGFSGIGTLIYYMFEIPVGTVILLLNIPLFLISYFKVGQKFFINAIIGTVLLSIFLHFFQTLNPITNDKVLAFLYGSVIVGIGTAIVLKANGSTGGTELLANIIVEYKPHFKTGNLIKIFDIIIVAANTLLFKNTEVALYSALSIYVMGKVLDIFFEGIDFTKMLLIISPKCNEIANRINTEIHRGSTALYGQGTYKKQDKKVLLCVMSRAEIRETRKIIEEIDSAAFIIITNAREVYGEGFKES